MMSPAAPTCDDGAVSFLEIRRHSHRKSGSGSQLSQAGVDLARRVGDRCGPYAEVVTSVLPRARETAIAMGFAVDRELVTQLTDEDVLAAVGRAQDHYLGGSPSDLDRGRVLGRFASWSWLLTADDRPIDDHDTDVLHRWSRTVAGLWRDLMTPYGTSDARVLFIGHSGDLEAGLVSCLPGADHAAWGECFAPLDGAVLEFSGEPARFRRATILRA